MRSFHLTDENAVDDCVIQPTTDAGEGKQRTNPLL